MLCVGEDPWDIGIGFDHATRQPRGLSWEDTRRIEIIREYGIDPFVMVYRDEVTGRASEDRQLRNVARWVNGRLFRSQSLEDYDPSIKKPRRRDPGPLWMTELQT